MDKIPKQRKKDYTFFVQILKSKCVFQYAVPCSVTSVICSSLRPQGRNLDCNLPGYSEARILEWVTHALLQGTFLTQGSNPGLLHGRQILYCLSHKDSGPKDICISVSQSNHTDTLWYCVRLLTRSWFQAEEDNQRMLSQRSIPITVLCGS